MKNTIKILLLIFVSKLVNAQSIVNTESMSSKLDSTFVLTTSFDGDYTSGNIDLVQFNSANQLAFKKGKNLVRLFFNYEYISENNEVLASDYTAQLRYNYTLGNNSVFTFLQSQKSKALSLNYRHLIGGGYRHNIYKKEDNYFDFS